MFTFYFLLFLLVEILNKPRRPTYPIEDITLDDIRGFLCWLLGPIILDVFMYLYPFCFAVFLVVLPIGIIAFFKKDDTDS